MLTDIIPSSFRALTPSWNRGDRASDFERSINRLMQDFLDKTPGISLPTVDWSGASVDFSPRIAVEETDDKFTLSAELPGLTEKDVDVQIERNTLTIKGEKKEEKSGREGSRYFNERSFGCFERAIELPNAIDKDKIAAKFEHGVLTVSLPKSPEAKREIKKIHIKH
jgi:HSP20 family protein